MKGQTGNSSWVLFGGKLWLVSVRRQLLEAALLSHFSVVVPGKFLCSHGNAAEDSGGVM